MRECTTSARDVVPGSATLSMMCTSTPRRASQSASTRPVGPAPTIKTSVCVFIVAQELLCTCLTSQLSTDAKLTFTEPVVNRGRYSRPIPHRNGINFEQSSRTFPLFLEEIQPAFY